MRLYEPMLATPAAEFPRSGGWVIQPKLDGWRILASVDVNGDVALTGRTKNTRYEGPVPYITAALSAALPPLTVLDGELVGESWGHVQSVMTSGTAHKPSEANPALTYAIFDVLAVNGQDASQLPLASRLELLDRLPTIDFATVVPTKAVDGNAEMLHQIALNSGFEGSVFKRLDGRYRAGRAGDWIKFKMEAECEAIITGYKPGKGEMAGLVGALIVELESGVTTTASGFDMTTRLALTERPDEFLGRRIEVKHNGVLPSGKVRHPRFHRFRDDKEKKS